MAVNLHGISRAAFDLIVESEVSSRAAYDRKYRRPERPGGQSGITVGIGYDCGYSTAATIRRDWGGKIPAAMVSALTSVAGLKGQAAQNVLPVVRPKVDVPWDVAIDVFSNVSIPKYLGFTRKGLPGFDDLTPDCKGVLLSLVYNRGASFQQAGARYAEMRAIRAAVISGDLALIPGLLRKMKRLWTTPSVRGVALRREEEARLFERGLKGARAPVMTEPEPDEPETEDAPAAPPVVPVAIDPGVVGDPDLYSAQKRLKGRHYSPGLVDGVWGSGTSGAISGFRNDSGMTFPMPGSLEEFHGIKDELAATLQLWEDQGKFRPVTEARKVGDAATVAAIAPEVVPAKRNFWAALWASIVSALTAAWDWISSSVGAAWDFFTDNRDSIPTDSGFLHTAWVYLASVPTAVWILGVAGIFAFIAFNSRSGVNKITESVATGARQ